MRSIEYDICSFMFSYGDSRRDLKSQELAKLMSDFKQLPSLVPCTVLSEKYECSKLTPKQFCQMFNSEQLLTV